MKVDFGQPLKLPPLTGRIRNGISSVEFLRPASEGKSLLDIETARILHDGRNRIGLIAASGLTGAAEWIAVKEFRTRGVDSLKSLFQRSKAEKAWTGAGALVEREIGTPFPVAFYEERRGGRVLRSAFLSEYLEGAIEIREILLTFTGDRLYNLILKVGRFLALCHSNNILHRDLSDGNILVRQSGSADPEFFLIDTNRIRVKKIRRLCGIKNLIRLGIPKSEQKSFLAAYLDNAEVPGIDRLWYRLAKTSYSSWIRTKRFLRLKRIVRRLKIQ